MMEMDRCGEIYRRLVQSDLGLDATILEEPYSVATETIVEAWE